MTIRGRLVLALVAVAGCHTTPATIESPPPIAPPVTTVEVAVDPPPKGRLGDKVLPTGYRLELEVDPSASGFRGHVAIELALAQPTRSLWLHGVGLTIERAVLRPGDGGPERILSELPAPPHSELYGFDFGQPVDSATATLEIDYTGVMGDRVGLFHQKLEGNWYVFTDFEPIDARRALPCFDDPRFKVVWQLSLVIPAGLTGLANTPPVASETLDDGRQRLRFAPTRPLPSYLVALAAGPFDVVDVPGTPVPVRVLTPHGRATWAEHAATVTPGLLAALTDYFSTPLPYPKIDLVAVPRFDGAMENPGLITFSQLILLAAPGPTPIGRRRLTAMVIAHELSHLWLGDLVTMAYWNDLWINEGFATFLADVIVSGWAPAELDWGLEEVAAKQAAMTVDERLGVRPVRRPIARRADITAAFDAITYKKGGAVLAMVEAMVGREAFQQGVNSYVRQHQDGSTTTADLVAALSAAAGRDLGPIVDSFVDQPGIPLIGAQTVCGRDGARVTLRQSRYLSLHSAALATAADRDLQWHVPICLRHGRGDHTTTTCTLLSDHTGVVDLPACPTWLYPNANEHGYYRITLSPAQLVALTAAPLGAREQLGLVDNFNAMLQSGAIELDDALAALPALARTATSRPATTALITTLVYLERAVVGDPERARFAALVRQVYGARARGLGLRARPGEDEDTTLLRPLLLELVGKIGADPHLASEARKLTERWLDSDRGIEPDLLLATVTTAAAAGDRALYTRFRQTLLAEPDAGERRRALLAGLGSFTRAELVDDALALAFSAPLGPSDVTMILNRVVASPRTSELGYAAITARDGLLAPGRAPGDRARSAYFAAYALRYACSTDRWDELTALVTANLGEADRQRIAPMLASLRAEVDECIAFRAHYQVAAKALFDSH